MGASGTETKSMAYETKAEDEATLIKRAEAIGQVRILDCRSVGRVTVS